MAKRGAALELAVLGLLSDAPMHGYELRKRLNALLGWGRVLSFGTLYPALKTLGRAGHIEAEPRRAKIVYRLTSVGQARLESLLEDAGPSAWEDDNFGVHFAFFARTDARTRVRILEGRRIRLEERLDQVRRAIPASDRPQDAYTTELHRHGLESVEREVRWLTRLIDLERAGRLPAAESTNPGESTTPPGGDTPARTGEPATSHGHPVP